jgi:hypothetical protein
MATYDMTLNSTVGVGADSIAAVPTRQTGDSVRKIEAYLDFTKLVGTDGYTLATGDVFQLLEIPAGYLVLNAGAEVMTAFDGTATVDVDFAGGDDIVHAFDVTSVGFAAAGTNGQTNTIIGSAASTFTQFLSAAATLDVTLDSADATVGVLRVYAVVMDCNEHATVATTVDRDQLG